jgi:kynurenine formamidase
MSAQVAVVTGANRGIGHAIAVACAAAGFTVAASARDPDSPAQALSCTEGALMQIVDLSQDIYEGMKVYPGHLKTVQFEHATHEETAPRFDSGFSFQTTGFMLNDNGPTHVDSFSHLDPDPSAPTIDKMPLDLFFGTAVCLDVTGFPPRTDITAEDLDRVETASPVTVQPGDIVLFHTGTWNRFAGDRRYLTEFAGLGQSASD